MTYLPYVFLALAVIAWGLMVPYYREGERFWRESGERLDAAKELHHEADQMLREARKGNADARKMLDDALRLTATVRPS